MCQNAYCRTKFCKNPYLSQNKYYNSTTKFQTFKPKQPITNLKQPVTSNNKSQTNSHKLNSINSSNEQITVSHNVKPKQNCKTQQQILPSCSEKGVEKEVESNKNVQDQVKTDVIKAIISCNQINNHSLPIIDLNFGQFKSSALLDSGANISLLKPQIIDQIKQFSKVKYLSRSVKIKTLDNNEIPYLSAVKLNFKIHNKWFENIFYVAQKPWSSAYDIILGYDFLQLNKILLDVNNKTMISNNESFPFKEMDPQVTDNSVINESTTINDEESEINNKNVAKLVNSIKIYPNKHEIVKLKLTENFAENEVVFRPKNLNQPIAINESLNLIDANNCFFTILENNTNNTIHLRKNQKIGYVEKFQNFICNTPREEVVCQINNLTLNEIKELRKQELTENDFDLNHLNDEDKKDMLNLLMGNYEVFSKSYATLGSTDQVVPEFKLLHDFPLVTKPYAIPQIAKNFAREEISKLLKAGIIEESTSSYSFPVIFVKKRPLSKDPNKQKFRLCIDYRLLNGISQSFQVCLPKISEIIQNIAGRKLYCVLDLKSAFFQIQLKKEDRPKLAFCTEFGNFCPTRLPFGARNSVAYFSTLINKCLEKLKGKNVQYFLDDIIIAAEDLTEMKLWLQKVFDKLKLFNLTLDPAKLQIAKPQITYLGFKLHKNGYSPSEQNIQKIQNFPIPKNVKQVQMFLGTINYFRHLIFNFSELVEPIVNLTSKKSVFVWDERCQNAFMKIQDILLHNPTLKNIDFSKEFYLVTDASSVALSAILMQKHEDNFYPIEFFSKKLSPAETRYPSIRRELYAIFASIKFFRDILFGRRFVILTDAKPLTFHIQLDKQPELVARWLLYIQSFEFVTKHIAGKNNPADYLSRVCEESNSVNVLNVFNTDNSLSKEKILEFQLKDEQCVKLRTLMNDKNASSSHYFVDSHSNLLMFKSKKVKGKFKNKVVKNKIYIPKLLIKDVLTQAHAPHFGVKKTYAKVNRFYYWSGMYKDTKSFCANCARCLEHKPKPNRTKFNLIKKSHLAPGEFVSLDIVGRLPRSWDNKNYIVTIIDQYSRFLEAIPLQNALSGTLIKALEQYFARFGLCKVILTDNGTNVCSNEFESFLKTLNIQHRKSSIYYPQSNGTIERAHRTLKESLAAMANEIFEWSTRLLFFKLEYNNSKHTGTSFSPAELFFGRNLNLPDNIFNEPLEVGTYDKYFESIKQHCIESRKMVQENEKKYFKTQEKQIKGRTKPEFKVNDFVFMKNFKHSGTFQKKYIGPYKIIKKLPNDNYQIKQVDVEDGNLIKIHVSKIFLQEQLGENML